MNAEKVRGLMSLKEWDTEKEILVAISLNLTSLLLYRYYTDHKDMGVKWMSIMDVPI